VVETLTRGGRGVSVCVCVCVCWCRLGDAARTWEQQPARSRTDASYYGEERELADCAWRGVDSALLVWGHSLSGKSELLVRRPPLPGPTYTCQQ
jgi:hypothetical protein